MEIPDRESILREISEVEKQLTDLREQKQGAEATLQSLRERLTKVGEQTMLRPSDASALRVATAATLTPDDKVALFLRLLRGRDDVYPKLWQNQKSGKKGYSPVCAHEWVRGVCEKPRVKCVECPNQAFPPVTADTVLDHLQGRHIIGVYPMLQDERCRFLAADFDKECWREDVLVFTDRQNRLARGFLGR